MIEVKIVEVILTALGVYAIIMLSLIYAILSSRSLPKYKPNRHEEKPPKKAALHGPSGTFRIVDEQKRKPKIFSDQEIWERINERSRGDSDSDRF